MENYTQLLNYGFTVILLVISAFEIFMIASRKRFNSNKFMGFGLIAFSLGCIIFALYAPYCGGLKPFVFLFLSWAAVISLSAMVFVIGLISTILYLNHFYNKGLLRTQAQAFAFVKAKYQRDFDLHDVLVYREKDGLACYWVLDVGTYIAVDCEGFVNDNWKREDMVSCEAGDIITLREGYKAKLVVKNNSFELVPTWKF